MSKINYLKKRKEGSLQLCAHACLTASVFVCMGACDENVNDNTGSEESYICMIHQRYCKRENSKSLI